ncbi:M14 family metallopeptidase [Cohnella abietis]|uniref:Peptidase M14 domain-containing protein n=1 Tax=Cohnella abietis TaxID=2507935 RepID=A0A3T1DBC3_9BACL|nr:M14 family metallocarboxypeptidase [Cohnella abietis]BBI35426.1 hypothetical protein KCTCHS21_48250 [Cohnella abietis]
MFYAYRRKITLLLILLSALFFLTGGSSTSSKIVQPKQVYTYETMVKDIKKLAAKYPELVRYRSIGKSEYGRDLWLIEIGNGPVNILLNGSHHAREWITTTTLMEMSESIAIKADAGSNWKKLSTTDLLQHVTYSIVPMVNPDGVTLQQSGPKAFLQKDQAALIRMNKGSLNFKRWKANAKGIDLNRQYPAGWGTIRNAASEPSYMNYKGQKPLEAKEARAMAELTRKLKPELAVSYHSSGEIVFWNYKTPSANLQRDRMIVNEYAAMTGYRVVNPESNPSGGGFTDWFIIEFGKPALTPELGRPSGETNVALSQWDRIWEQHQNTPWLLGSRIAELWINNVQTVAVASKVELVAASYTYSKPSLNLDTRVRLAAGIYEAIREKGSWIEIRTEQGNRWLAKGLTHKVSKEVDKEEEKEIEKEPDEQVTEPGTEPVTNSVTNPGTESVTEPVSE